MDEGVQIGNVVSHGVQAAQEAARAYQEQAQQQQGSAGSSKKDDDGVVDADYKIVDE